MHPKKPVHSVWLAMRDLAGLSQTQPIKNIFTICSKRFESSDEKNIDIPFSNLRSSFTRSCIIDDTPSFFGFILPVGIIPIIVLSGRNRIASNIICVFSFPNHLIYIY